MCRTAMIPAPDAVRVAQVGAGAKIYAKRPLTGVYGALTDQPRGGRLSSRERGRSSLWSPAAVKMTTLAARVAALRRFIGQSDA